MAANVDKLIDFLDKPQVSIEVVVMPDFFLDRIISVPFGLKDFSLKTKSVVTRSGGSLDQIPQVDQKGGNAINVASALLSLGAKVTPIVCTNKLGQNMIHFYLKDYDFENFHIKTYTKASVTTALEFNLGDGKSNVMLRDLGSLEDFGPKELNQKDYALIEKADFVCVFNWAGTRTFGTQLAKTVFSRTKNCGVGKTYLNTADPLPNKTKIPELIKEILKTNLVDIFSLNENEAVTYASYLSDEVSSKRTN